MTLPTTGLVASTIVALVHRTAVTLAEMPGAHVLTSGQIRCGLTALLLVAILGFGLWAARRLVR